MVREWGILASALALLSAPVVAEARELTFHATLRGDSKATGAATIMVDTHRETVDLRLDVAGLRISDLWDRLAASPVAPIHLHLYPSHNHADPQSASIVFIVPASSTYTITPRGFRVRIHDASYVTAAKVLGSDIPFEHFVSALQAGMVVMNIHTNAHNDGEISGSVNRVDPVWRLSSAGF